MNARRSLFCQYYIVCLDAQKAALEAGYSPKRAKQTGYDLLQNDEIKAEIAQLKTMRDRLIAIEAADVLRELAHIALTDLGDLLEWGMQQVFDDKGVQVTLPDGTALTRPVIRPVESWNLTTAQRRAIKSVSVSEKGAFKLELHDRVKSLELLGRYFGLFEKDNKQKGEATANSLAALIAACQGAPLMPNAMIDAD